MTSRGCDRLEWRTSFAIAYGALAGAMWAAMAGPASAESVTGTVEVSAAIVARCELQTTPLAFGTVTPHTQAGATATLSVTCSDGTPYAVLLADGESDQRLMHNGNSDLAYRIFRDAAHGIGWSSDPSNVPASGRGVGNGHVQLFTMYGLATPGAAARPGIYTDTIIVQVAY